MPTQSTTRHLGENVFEWIGNFLYQEGFPRCEITQKGILHLLDSIEGYTEEGQKLYPEVVLTRSLEGALEQLPSSQAIVVAVEELTEKSFKRALKRCAPLAKGSWAIFLEVSDARITYGVASGEISELGASLHRHLVGDLSTKEGLPPIAYIRSVGSKFVELSGTKTTLPISLSLSKTFAHNYSELESLATLITSSLEEFKSEAFSFFHRMLENANKEGHGSIVAVVDDGEAAQRVFQAALPDGAYLPLPIDLFQKLQQALETQTRQASAILREFAAVAMGMIEHDGIAVFTTKGKLIAYNVFIRDTANIPLDESGGARSRAFAALKASGVIKGCFFQSHDGRLDFWENENV